MVATSIPVILVTSRVVMEGSGFELGSRSVGMISPASVRQGAALDLKTSKIIAFQEAKPMFRMFVSSLQNTSSSYGSCTSFDMRAVLLMAVVKNGPVMRP